MIRRFFCMISIYLTIFLLASISLLQWGKKEDHRLSFFISFRILKEKRPIKYLDTAAQLGGPGPP